MPHRNFCISLLAHMYARNTHTHTLPLTHLQMHTCRETFSLNTHYILHYLLKGNLVCFFFGYYYPLAPATDTTTNTFIGTGINLFLSKTVYEENVCVCMCVCYEMLCNLFVTCAFALFVLFSSVCIQTCFRLVLMMILQTFLSPVIENSSYWFLFKKSVKYLYLDEVGLGWLAKWICQICIYQLKSE